MQYLSKEDVLQYVSVREGEKKLGENIQVGNIEDLAEKGVQYIVFGVEESVGPRANCGLAGSENGWKAFLNAFLNIQHNQFMDPRKIGILGSLKYEAEGSEINDFRTQTEQIDADIEKVVEQIQSKNIRPILIGGGHNNCYPLISGTSKAFGGKINAINCDPHADFRPMEGRHSGNGFSFAMNQGHLDKYFILGLHQSYNGDSIFKEFDKANDVQVKVLWTYFDDWIYGKSSLEKDLMIGMDFVREKRVGLELDMDAIAFMPSSAIGPSGLTLNEARKYISTASRNLNIAYLHLPEAAPKNELEEKMVGKALAYLVSDFMKNNRE